MFMFASHVCKHGDGWVPSLPCGFLMGPSAPYPMEISTRRLLLLFYLPCPKSVELTKTQTIIVEVGEKGGCHLNNHFTVFFIFIFYFLY